MIKPIELVIFDCDGVLVDSERLAVRLQIALGAELGWPLTADEVVARFIGRAKESIVELAWVARMTRMTRVEQGARVDRRRVHRLRGGRREASVTASTCTDPS
ncbi:hypothetical protein [Streptomyces solicamelliae]|uniref:hypothetical protein n=1 Tax=Streptomyces solicamelliae TaxID=3231716 RepID=UPI0038781295